MKPYSNHFLIRAGAMVTILAAAATAHADRRSFTYTYEYATAPQGTTDVELYNTQSLATFDDGSPRRYQLQVEVEHGVTDRFDVALYHVYSQTSSTDPMAAEPLHFEKVKARARYRVAERGELPVDVLGYFEVAKDFAASAYEIEGKGIFARDFAAVTAAANLVAAVELGGDVPEAEIELAWAAGLTYEAGPRLRAGAESYGGFNVDHTDEIAASVGPSVSWAPSTSLWIAATVGFGLTDHASALDARMILGLAL